MFEKKKQKLRIADRSDSVLMSTSDEYKCRENCLLLKYIRS